MKKPRTRLNGSGFSGGLNPQTPTPTRLYPYLLPGRVWKPLSFTTNQSQGLVGASPHAQPPCTTTNESPQLVGAFPLFAQT